MPPCNRQRRFLAMGYLAHGVPERVFAPHLRGLVVGSSVGLCSHIIFAACRRGLTLLVQIQHCAKRMSYICVTSDTWAFRGQALFILDIFWVWVDGDPVLYYYPVINESPLEYNDASNDPS